MRWFPLITLVMLFTAVALVVCIAVVEAFEYAVARYGYVWGLGGVPLLIVVMVLVLSPASRFISRLFDWLDRASIARRRSITAERLSTAQGLSRWNGRIWSNKSELEAVLREAGLGEWAPRLASLARHCIILAPGPLEEGEVAPIGASRLGGEPDMPPDVDWPVRPPMQPEGDLADPMPGRVLLGRGHWFHRLFHTQRWRDALQGWERSRQAERDRHSRTWPLSFVAQVDFAELHAVRPLDGFPAAGRLLLFCDGVDFPWGAREEQAHAHAMFTELPADRLQRRRHPPEFDAARHPGLRDEFVFKPRTLRPTAWLLPPPPGSCEMIALSKEQPRTWSYKHEGPAVWAYDRFWDDLRARHAEIFGERGREVMHQVGGFAWSIQGPVEAECVKFAEHGPGRRGRQRDPHMYAPTKEQRARAGEWRLVLQIDSDIEVGMQWGDMGRLYLCARTDDLAARRFDRCWMVAQCY